MRGEAGVLEVLRLLGQGAFGRVELVRDPTTGAEYARKVVPLRGDAARVEREVRVALELRHPRVLRCFAGRVEEDHAWILMEVAEGSLADWIGEPARLPETWEALRQTAEGVAALHRAGLVHRDLKPANVMRTSEGAKVGDLGLVRGGDMQTLTATGTLLGTPVYMSPEQVRGERPGPASDAWALGVLFYEALEGAPPYPELPAGDLLVRIARGERAPFARARSLLPPEVLARLEALLAPEPAARPEELSLWAEGLGPLPEAAGKGGGARTQRVPGPDRAPTLRPEGSPARAIGTRTAPLPVPGPARASAVEDPAPRPRARGAALVLGVAGVLAIAALVGPEEPSPAPPTEVAEEPGPPAPPAPLSVFPAEVLDGIYGRVQRLTERCLALGGSIGACPPGGGGTLVASWAEDPEVLPEVLEETGLRAHVLDWLAGGGDPLRLPVEEREGLERIEAELRALGFPAVLRPYLELRPSPEALELGPLTREHLRDIENPVPRSPRADGWLGTAYREAEALVLELGRWENAFAAWWVDAGATWEQARGEMAVRGGGERFDPGERVREVEAMLRVAQGPVAGLAPPRSIAEAQGPERSLLKFSSDARVRVAISRRLARVHRVLRRFLLAVGRALREDPERARDARDLVTVLHRHMEIYWMGTPGYLPVQVLLGGWPETTDALFAALFVVRIAQRMHESGLGDGPEYEALRVELAQRILDLEDGDAGTRLTAGESLLEHHGEALRDLAPELGERAAPHLDALAALLRHPRHPVQDWIAQAGPRSGGEQRVYDLLVAALLSSKVLDAAGPELLEEAATRLERLHAAGERVERLLREERWEAEAVIARVRRRLRG